ncbi:MAG: hypothetical protein ACPH4K_07980 [Flavobacteriaceae bacterium]
MLKQVQHDKEEGVQHDKEEGVQHDKEEGVRRLTIEQETLKRLPAYGGGPPARRRWAVGGGKKKPAIFLEMAGLIYNLV